MTDTEDNVPIPSRSLVTQQNQTRMGFTDLQGFELLQRAAKALASSTMVPNEYRGNIPNCLIALEMANRMGASPLLVMQNLFLIHGRPSWSAKFLVATFNQSGRFSAIRFRWEGEKDKDSWGCRAWSIEKENGQELVGPLITIGLAKKEGWHDKSGSKWKTIPELMLSYRAAAWLVNIHAPEISMGLNTAEELHDVYDAIQNDDGDSNGSYEVVAPGRAGQKDVPVRSKVSIPEIEDDDVASIAKTAEYLSLGEKEDK
jgi:uncharacterized membrane protein YecN with MAPEG domain